MKNFRLRIRKLKQKKAQVSIEAMVAVAVIFAFFIVTSVFFSQKSNEVSATRKYLNQLEVCMKLSNVITDIYANGEGSDFLFYTSYANISISNTTRAITIENEGVLSSCRFPLMSVTNLTSNNFTIQKGLIRVRNINSTVVINNY
ncbi:MAG TPA: hypothetical protein VI894_01100 [Candidatus Nanoarchaeia archaeon]|nr:hypothetical protein [Candidatus Nanoarchaeia archaeon]